MAERVDVVGRRPRYVQNWAPDLCVGLEDQVLKPLATCPCSGQDRIDEVSF
jgi:hypothetical protein